MTNMMNQSLKTEIVVFPEEPDIAYCPNTLERLGNVFEVDGIKYFVPLKENRILHVEK